MGLTPRSRLVDLFLAFLHLVQVAAQGSSNHNSTRITTSILLSSNSASSAMSSSTASQLSASTTSLLIPSATSSSPSTTSMDRGLPLHTHITPAFGVLGVLLILAGLPVVFVGHRSKLTAQAPAGAFSLALVVICAILKLGVERSIKPPSSPLEGVFLVACLIASAAGYVLALVFHEAAVLLCATLAGFLFGLFLQACKSDGLIANVGLRYILYAGVAVGAFCIAIVPRFRIWSLIVSSSVVGSSSLLLGIDCFSSAGLKETYVRNLGFDSLFVPKATSTGSLPLTNGHWPLPVPIIVELIVLGGLCVMGIAFQRRLFHDWQSGIDAAKHKEELRKLKLAAKRASKHISRTVSRDLEEWEKHHGYAAKTSSAASGEAKEGLDAQPKEPGSGGIRRFIPFLRSKEPQRVAEDYESTLIGTPAAKKVPLPTIIVQSDTLPATPIASRRGSLMDYLRDGPQPARAVEHKRSLTLPALDLGTSLLPSERGRESPIGDVEGRRQSLLDEIAQIRKSIHNIRSSSVGSSLTSQDRPRPSSALLAPVGSSSEGGHSFRRNSMAGSYDLTPVRPAQLVNRHSMFSDRTSLQGVTQPLPGPFLDVATAASSARPSSPFVEPPFAWAMPEVTMHPYATMLVRPPRQHEHYHRMSRSPDPGSSWALQAAVAQPAPPSSPTRLVSSSPRLSPARPKASPSYQQQRSSMSSAQLEARHRANMERLQGPATRTLEQRQSLAEAKEAWARRLAAEKRAWDAKEADGDSERQQRRKSGRDEENKRKRLTAQWALDAAAANHPFAVQSSPTQSQDLGAHGTSTVPIVSAPPRSPRSPRSPSTRQPPSDPLPPLPTDVRRS